MSYGNTVNVNRPNNISVISVSNNVNNDIDKLKRSKDDEKEIGNLVLLKSSLLYQIKEFFNNSTLHGVRYIAETGRPFIEK